VVTLDGIIFSLQRTGGISVCFQEFFKRVVAVDLDAELLLFDKSAETRVGGSSKHIRQCRHRFLERYRDCEVSPAATLFHSSYYRVPVSNKIPVVTTVHDFTYERFNSGIKRWVHSSQKFNAIKKASAIICVSDHTRKDLLELLPEIEAEKVHVIHNGVGSSFFPIEVESNYPTHRPYVLFVGSRVFYKNFRAVAESLENLTDLEIVCVGGGDFSEDELKFLEYKVPGRYRHEGDVSEKKLNQLYNQAQCLLYPSSYEGFGIPVLEAMSAGCPVVALNSSSIPEVAGDAALLLDSADPDLLVAAIEQTADTAFRREIRQKGFLQAQLFSWDQSFIQTLKVYEEVTGCAFPYRPL